jgi:hypothetical protein
VGSFDRIRVYSWSGRKNLWEENAAKEIKYLYRYQRTRGGGGVVSLLLISPLFK